MPWKETTTMEPTMCDRSDIRNHCLQIWTKTLKKDGQSRLEFRLTSWGVDNGYVVFILKNGKFKITDSYYVSSIE